MDKRQITKNRKKKRRQAKQQEKEKCPPPPPSKPLAKLEDIKLSHCADRAVTRCSCQEQKSAASMKSKVETETKAEDKAWYEKDEYGTSKLDKLGNVKGNRVYCTWDAIAEDPQGIDLPLDVWFLISEHILPEDVANFGAICYSTYYVVSTAKFWNSLYRRHQKLMPGLPEELTIWNMDNERGLKANVIRALFYVYPPFHARIISEKPLSADPTRLLRTECVLQWHVKVGKLYKYYFKFTKENPDIKKKFGNEFTNLMPEDSFVHINPNSGCSILEAITTTVCAVPMVMGEYLHHAGLGVSADLKSHRLNLSLAPAHLLPRPNSTKTTKYKIPYKEVLLEPVRDIRVYPWWHPHYHLKCRT